MKVLGLVVEYNPFHNGHLYQIQQMDKLFGENIKIAVMSGDYVQRGEPAIINKFDRADLAIKSGIDIVIELPCFYSTQSAELFASSAVRILNKFACDFLVFGSESSDIEKLKSIANILQEKNTQNLIKNNIKNGMSYASACFQILGDKLLSNDILAVEYIKAINYYKLNMKPYCIKRISSNYYDETYNMDNISSASYIRKNILSKKDFKDLVPEETYHTIMKNNLASIEIFFDLIRYKIINDRDCISKILDVEVGLENRIYKNILEHKDYKKFFDATINPRITVGRLQRILMHTLLDIKKEHQIYIQNNIPFIKIISFNEKGKKYLNKIKKTDAYNDINVISTKRNIKKTLKDEDLYFFELNEKASEIYKIKSYYDKKYIIGK